MSTAQPAPPSLPVLHELLLRIEVPSSPFYGHVGGLRVAALFVESDDATVPDHPEFDAAVLLQHLRRLRSAVEKTDDADTLKLVLESIEGAEAIGRAITPSGCIWPPFDGMGVPPAW